MNSQTNLTTAKIRRTLLIAALVICPFLAINSSNAQTATATLTSGGLNSITISSNQSFQLSLAVTTDFVATGYSVFYQSTNGSGLFRIVARQNTSPINATTGMPVFDDDTFPDSTALTPAAGLLDPRNDFELGYTGDSINNQPAGSYSLQLLTINTLNAPVGTYTISLVQASMSDFNGGAFTDRDMFATFTVTVIPEPTTVGLAVVGGGVLLVGAWRKRRARAQA